MFDPCKGALPAVRKGLQRALAVASAVRLAGLPDVPTFAEIGIPGYNLPNLDWRTGTCGDTGRNRGKAQ